MGGAGLVPALFALPSFKKAQLPPPQGKKHCIKGCFGITLKCVLNCLWAWGETRGFGGVPGIMIPK